MADGAKLSAWENLPDEIFLQIIACLDPYSILRLHVLSRRLRKLCLDNEVWKQHSFNGSTWYAALESHRNLLAAGYRVRGQHAARAGEAEVEAEAEPDVESPQQQHPDEQDQVLRPQSQKAQDLANWDPVFPGERVSWYDEYRQRHGPASISWFQTPRIRDRDAEAAVDAKGLALYNPYDGDDGLGTMLAVSPLDDASVCLWDVRGTRGKQGAVIACSEPGILFFDGPGNDNTRRSKMVDTGVVECVSVDSHRHRAFFAVQSHLIEVDLNRLEVTNRQTFEWSITTLSQIHDGMPLTVGTSLGIHLHDFRARSMVPHEVVDRVDTDSISGVDVFKTIFDTTPLPPYASLSQPTPISILHLPQPGSHSLVSNDIYVAGRFSNILHYDRRKFPAIASSIYSGALIKGMAALPYPYSALDSDVRRGGELTPGQVMDSKTSGSGRTLIAGGGYKTKGSLEIYGLGPSADSLGSAMVQNSTLKNRQSAAASTILSIVNHGTKIAFSDGSGYIKWFERDGITECRREKIGHCDVDEASLFSSMPGSDDLARKILSTKSEHGYDQPNRDNIVFWTGEKLGLLGFTYEPLFDEQDFQDRDSSATDLDEEDRLYSNRMREALERQADDVRFVRGLGMGTLPG